MSRTNDSRIREIAAGHGLVLLYHYVQQPVPPGLGGTLHGVSPRNLQRHIEQLSRWFTFVDLEDFARSKDRRGLAAVTFDDGYANVLDNAAEVLEGLNCPATLFLNPLTFSGRWNWRDKVRYVIRHGLEAQFGEFKRLRNRTGRFYRHTKHPDNNSREVDAALEEFLAGRDIDVYGGYPYLRADRLSTSRPGIRYGNHSQNHYVLSSLTPRQRASEIRTAHELLGDIPATAMSGCFSVPFGGTRDITPDIADIAAGLGYHSLLMSRQRLQPGTAETAGMNIIERFMPGTADIVGEIAGRFT